MTAFDLPTLANITMPPGTWSEPMFVAQNNKKFEFTLTEGERWYRITGRDNLLIPVEAPTTTAVPTTAGPTTTTLSAAQLRTLDQKNQAENEEKQKTTGMFQTNFDDDVEFRFYSLYWLPCYFSIGHIGHVQLHLVSISQGFFLSLYPDNDPLF